MSQKIADVAGDVFLLFKRAAGVMPWLFTCGCIGIFVYDNITVFPFIHPETIFRAPFYGSSRNQGLFREVSKIFDVCIGEAGARALDGGQNLCISRGRPLSFLVDLIDSKSLIAINRHVHLAPRNISHYIIAALTAFFLYKTFRLFFPRQASWGRGMSAAAASLYLIAPETLTMNGFYFRSAKELAGLFIAIAFYMFCSWRRSGLSHASKAFWCAVLCVGALSDETAVAVIGLMAVVVAIDSRASASERLGMVLCYSLPVGSYLMCQRWLDGFLALKLEGVPTTPAFASPSNFVSLNLPLLKDALSAMVFRLQLHLGNPQMQAWVFPAFIVAAVATACYLARHASAVDENTEAVMSWQQTVVLSGGMCLVYCVMGMRHPAILDKEIRLLGYYYIALFLVALFALAQLPALRHAFHIDRTRPLVFAGMVAVALSYATSTPRLRLAYFSTDANVSYLVQHDSQLLERWWDGRDAGSVAQRDGSLVAYRDWLIRTVDRTW